MGRGMREVDLVEHDAVPGSSAPRPVRRRPPWPWLAGGALVLVATLVMLQTAVDARRSLAEDRPVRTVLAIPAPARALTALWKVDGAAQHSAEVGDVLVSLAAAEEGAAVVGIDPTTGARLWSVAVPVEGVAGADGGECAVVPGPAPASSRVACVTRRPEPTVPGPVRVAVVDVASRSLLGAWTSRAQAWGVMDDRVVTALPDDDGTTTAWTLTAHDLAGTEVWTTTTSRAPGTDPGSPVVDTSPLGQLAGGRGWLAVTEGSHAWVVGVDGTVLADREVRDGFVYASGSGATVFAEDVLTAEPQSTVLLDGAEVRAPGVPLAPRADDGSARDVELWASRDGGRVVARDATTGVELWHDTDAFPDSGTVAVQDGTVYVAAQDGVRARDAHRGTLLWTAPLPGATGVTVDGDLVLAVSANNLTALAIDPRTGRAVWKADVEDAVPAGAPQELPFLTTWRHLLSLGVGEDAWVIG